MKAIIRITSVLENSIFGQLNGVYIGNPLNLEYQSEGKEAIKMSVYTGDKVIIDFKPIDSILTKLQTTLITDTYYDVDFLGFLTAGNKSLPATITLTNFNFSYSELDGE